MFFKILITVCALIFVVNCDVCDKSACPNIPKHYNELGCTPVLDKEKCCTSHYDCPNLAGRDATKCYFKGKTYEDHEGPNSTVTGIPCTAACTCSPGYGENIAAKFICAQKDCGHWFDHTLINCIGLNEAGKCCATKFVCEEEEKNKLAKCYLDGQEYREGQRMFPTDETCYTCLCVNGFDNTTVVGNPNCNELNCGIELHNLDYFVKGCIPIYFKNRCCPISWKCPAEDDAIIKNENRNAESTEATCKFGDKVLQLGDSITDTNKCIKCKCLVPPMLNCVNEMYGC